MKELTINELEQVNGGVVPLAVAAGLHLLSSAGIAWRTYRFAVRMK